MPDDLLLELETAGPVAGNLANAGDLVRVVRREVGWAVEGMKGSAQTFEKTWQRLVIEVARGHTAEIQALRPRLLEAFEKRLGLLRETHALATWLAQRGGTGIPEPASLVPELDGLERLKAGVFDRWQTAEDLEDLAARDYPLTVSDLERIGPHRQPAAAWYAEEGKPF
jgi:hypothetical protein